MLKSVEKPERRREMGIKISGTGFYVPERVVSNNDLEKMVETSDEWITQRVGVKTRHIAEDETAVDMAVSAATDALKKSGISASEIDMVIGTTITSDLICPTVGGAVAGAIGADCPAFDLNSACSGFIFALDIAEKYLRAGAAKKILIVSAERMSKIIDWTDRGTCVIFGDGAGAAIVESGDMYESVLYTDGDDSVIKIPNYSIANPFRGDDGIKPYVHMNGQETFKFAVNKVVSDIRAAAEKAGISVQDIDYIIPHQANIRIIQFAAKRLGLPEEKFFTNIQSYGNTSSASIPMALAEFSESVGPKSGDIIALTAFGGGLSSGACVFKW